MFSWYSSSALSLCSYYSSVLGNIYRYSSSPFFWQPSFSRLSQTVVIKSTALSLRHLLIAKDMSFPLFISFFAALTSSLLILCPLSAPQSAPSIFSTSNALVSIFPSLYLIPITCYTSFPAELFAQANQYFPPSSVYSLTTHSKPVFLPLPPLSLLSTNPPELLSTFFMSLLQCKCPA